MSVQGGTVTLTTDLVPGAVAGTGVHGVIRVYVRNRGAGSIYLGSSGVTSGGAQLTTGDPYLPVIVYPGESLYAMSTGGAAVLDVLRMNDTT
jgi:hypothetical protein